ncbi:MAG: hypothetical protein ACJAS1_004386 [Oleiphilaceae bacterium]|jgi:hypothetical protein
MFETEEYYFRVKYRKLDTACKLCNGLRSDIKFEFDADNQWVFALYPEFETLSEEDIVGDEWEALNEGTAIIRKPISEDKNGYFDMIRDRVKVGAKAYFVGGSHKLAEFEIIQIINAI